MLHNLSCYQIFVLLVNTYILLIIVLKYVIIVSLNERSAEDMTLNYLNHQKKINLHKFVRNHLPDYTIVDHFEVVDTDDGEELVESIIVKPNAYKKSISRYVLKINNQTGAVIIDCDSIKSVNLELDYVNGINHYNDFIDKFDYNAVNHSKVEAIIRTILDIGVKYKFYQHINISAFINNVFGLFGKSSLRDDVSTFFKYDILGGLAPAMKTEFGYFSIKKKKILNDNIGFNEMICLSTPVRDDEVFDIIILNNNGVDEIYGILNSQYVQLKTDEDLNNFIREIFFNAAKTSIYYKFGVEDQELNEAYITLIEMETI